jgi:hypothetical protein
VQFIAIKAMTSTQSESESDLEPQPQKPKPKPKLPPIPDYIFKNLLQHLEGEGQPSREDINLLSICNNSNGIYGTPASGIRRAIQRKFGKLKEKTLNQYVAVLDYYNQLQSAFYEKLQQQWGAIYETRTKKILVSATQTRKTI